MYLGIESSCDETALALMTNEGKIKGEWVLSQIEKHAEYGGVVPDLAVGEHLKNFIPLLDLANQEFELSRLVTKIAVTRGPGLVGCLAMGMSFAKSLASIWSVPLAGINHLHGHAFSVFIPVVNEKLLNIEKYLPHLGLLVSGGNTVLFKIGLDLKLSVLAKTADDAAGEALDKGAKLLGIPYPGGAEMERFAVQGNPDAFDFPRAFSQRKEMKFSFSGLKTSLLYRLNKLQKEDVLRSKYDFCASYQKAVIDQLALKTSHALSLQPFKSLGLSGGVANNESLRKRLLGLSSKNNIYFLPAEKRHTGDNAAMIAFAALIELEKLSFEDEKASTFDPSLKLGEY